MEPVQPERTQLSHLYYQPEQNLTGMDEARSVISQFNPGVMNDVTKVEKGMENYFLFHHSHLALTGLERLEHLSQEEIEYFGRNRIFELFSYLALDETGILRRKRIAIRPPSLRGDIIAEAKTACLKGSVIAAIQRIQSLTDNSANLEKKGILKNRLVEKVEASAATLPTPSDESGVHPLNRKLAALKSLSFESLLNSEAPALDDSLFLRIISYLATDSSVVNEEFKGMQDFSDETASYLRGLGKQPVLFTLHPDFHIPVPPPRNLVEKREQLPSELRSEPERILEIFRETGTSILHSLKTASGESPEIQPGVASSSTIVSEWTSHTSFLHSERWPDSAFYLETLQNLSKFVKIIQSSRLASIAASMTEQVTNQLNGRFEPYLFTVDDLKVNPQEEKRFGSRTTLFQNLVEQLKANRDILHYNPASPENEKEENTSIYLIYAINLPGAFIRQKNMRNMLHAIALQNGYKSGIYDFLVKVDPSVHPESIVKEQIQLANSIREWENQKSETRKKKEKKSGGFIDRIADSIVSFFMFFANLFGGTSQKKRNTGNFGTESDETTGTGPAGGRLVSGPGQRKLVIPSNVIKAIDFVERNNKGLIWVDEVVKSLASVNFDETKIIDMLFFDEKGRYREIRALNGVRPLFLRNENLQDAGWLSDTINYLENLSKPTKATALAAQRLKEFLESAGQN